MRLPNNRSKKKSERSSLKSSRAENVAVRQSAVKASASAAPLREPLITERTGTGNSVSERQQVWITCASDADACARGTDREVESDAVS